MIFEGNKYSRKGFLYKNFVMNAILAEGVKPTLAELERYVNFSLNYKCKYKFDQFQGLKRPQRAWISSWPLWTRRRLPTASPTETWSRSSRASCRTCRAR